jgi:hypothetical protein
MIVPGHSWRERLSLNNIRLPNLRAILIQELDPVNQFLEDVKPPRYTIDLRIQQDTSLATISSILRYPLDWSLADEERTRSRVLGITRVGVSGDAAFVCGNPGHNGLFTPISAGLRGLTLSADPEDALPNPERLETSARTMLQLVPCSNIEPQNVWGVPYQYPRLQILCDSREVVRFWLREVRYPARSRRTTTADLPMTSFPHGSSIIATFCPLSFSTALS